MDAERIERVVAIGTEHAFVETERDLERTMATLEDDPVYEFQPVGGVLRGRTQVRRYYEHLMNEFLPRVESAELVAEWPSEHSLAQEYEAVVRVDGSLETHRLLGILLIGAERLQGERIWGSERALRLMLGPLFDELELLAPGR